MFYKFIANYQLIKDERGSAALEYIVVSVFGLILSIAAITFISQSIDEKFANLEESTGIKFDASSLNPFNEK